MLETMWGRTAYTGVYQQSARFQCSDAFWAIYSKSLINDGKGTVTKSTATKESLVFMPDYSLVRVLRHAVEVRIFETKEDFTLLDRSLGWTGTTPVSTRSSFFSSARFWR